jgi:hypothetical protein
MLEQFELLDKADAIVGGDGTSSTPPVTGHAETVLIDGLYME